MGYLYGILRNCSGINATSLCIYTIHRQMRLTVHRDRCTCIRMWHYEMVAPTRNNESAWNLCRRDANCMAISNLLSKFRQDLFDWLKQPSLLWTSTWIHFFYRINHIANEKLIFYSLVYYSSTVHWLYIDEDWLIIDYIGDTLVNISHCNSKYIGYTIKVNI